MARWISLLVLAAVALGAGGSEAWAADSDGTPAPVEQELPLSPEIEETEVATDVLGDAGEPIADGIETSPPAAVPVPESFARTPPMRPPRA